MNVWPGSAPESMTSGEFVPGAGMPVWRIVHQRTEPPAEPRPDLLFARADAAQEHDEAAERPEVVAALAGRLAAHARQLGAPPEPLARLRLE